MPGSAAAGGLSRWFLPPKTLIWTTRYLSRVRGRGHVSHRSGGCGWCAQQLRSRVRAPGGGLAGLAGGPPWGPRPPTPSVVGA